MRVALEPCPVPAVDPVHLGANGSVTQSDFDFVGQLVESRFTDPPARLRMSTIVASWYSILIAGALVAGAVIGFAT